MTTIYVLLPYSFFCMQMEKNPLSEFKQKPYATFGPQHLNYNMRKIFQQTPSAHRASGNPFLGYTEADSFPELQNPELLPVCKARLASGTRTNTSLNTTKLLHTEKFTEATITTNNITHTAVYIFILLTKPECYSISFDISGRFPVRFDKFLSLLELLNRFTEVDSIRK